MRYRTLLALAAACVLGPAVAGSAAQAQDAAARRQFANLVAPRGGGVRALDVAELDPTAVRAFDARLTRYLRRNGLVPPRATSRLAANRFFNRRRFLLQRFTPGATVGGVFFSTAATPSAPTSGINPVTFFPVYTGL